MSRQCYLVLDLFLLELQCLGWTEKSDAKDIEDGNINIESNLGVPSYLQAADAAVLCNIIRLTVLPLKMLG